MGPKWQTAPSYIVAPYYSVYEKTGTRAGYSKFSIFSLLEVIINHINSLLGN
jgi:hypothetical protein